MGIYIFFGKPGSGKTTIEARISYEHNHKKKNFITGKRYTALYSTDPTIKGCIPIRYDDLGKFEPPFRSAFILSEAGIGLNNRNWKKLDHDAIEFFAKHRHREVDVFLDSQTLDIDVSVRMRVSCNYICKKLAFWTILIPVTFNIDVDNDQKTLMECYERPVGLMVIASLLTGQSKLFLRRKYYPWFDTYEWSKEWKDQPPTIYVDVPRNKRGKMR